MKNQTINYRRLFIFLLLGFSSGLPLALTGSTLQAWFTTSGISIVTIGALSLVGQPYVYKFLWAPLLDRYIPPFLGRRRGWLMIIQFALLLSIIAMAFGDPLNHAGVISILALLVAFFSASQDIAVDAYRTEATPAEERGLSSAFYSGGYRIAMLVSGGLGLILAGLIGWQETYLIMSALIIIGLIATWFGEEPVLEKKPPTTLYAAVVDPFREFLSRKSAWAFLLVIVLYKFGDALSLSLTTPFLIRGLGFSLITIGSVNKLVGLIGSMTGILLGGAIMIRLSLYRSLFLFGILQMVAILMLMILAIVGKNYVLLVVTLFIDNLFNGMGTAALMALTMSLCDQHYTATQYALLSAIASVARVFIGPIAGVMVEHLGWPNFFAWSLVVCVPGLIALWWVRHRIGTLSLQAA